MRDLQNRRTSGIFVNPDGGFEMTGFSSNALVGLLAAAFVACTFPSVAEDTANATELKPALLIDADEGEAINFPLHPTTRLAGAGSNDASLSLFEINVPANRAGAPPHRHTHEDEFFYVREGAVTFMADGEQKTISPGGLAMLPRGGTHAMWNAGNEDAILLVGASAGKFDDFFDAVAMEVASAGDLTPPEIGEIIDHIGAARGIIIDMSLVPDSVRPLYGMPPIKE